MSSPLPDIQSDPAFLAAQTAAAEFTVSAQAVRANFQATPLMQAQTIATNWEAANAAIGRAWADLNARRQARLTALESLIPVGPNIPADASPADAALLHQLFRQALDQARAQTEGGNSDAGLRAMLVDAERFGDDTLRRAVMTAAVDSNQPRLINDWAAQAGLSAELAELIGLRAALAGQADLTTQLFQRQVFLPIRKPAEVDQLPGLLKTDQQSRLDFARTGVRTTQTSR